MTKGGHPTSASVVPASASAPVHGFLATGPKNLVMARAWPVGWSLKSVAEMARRTQGRPSSSFLQQEGGTEQVRGQGLRQPELPAARGAPAPSRSGAKG